MSKIDSTRLRELLKYNQRTGVFTWRMSAGSRCTVGAVAGSVERQGYRVIGLDGQLYKEHRLAWLYVHGVWPTNTIDHKNGKRDDNRMCNLRDVPHSENMRNLSKPRSNNTSGYLGVYPYKGKWHAAIRIDGKQKVLGVYETPEKAHAAYLKAKVLRG